MSKSLFNELNRNGNVYKANMVDFYKHFIYLQLSSHQQRTFLQDNRRYLLSIKCFHLLKPAPTHFLCMRKYTHKNPSIKDKKGLFINVFIHYVSFPFSYIFDCGLMLNAQIYSFCVCVFVVVCCYLTALIKLQSATPVKGPFCSLVLP